jgi:hypothetical protein
VSGVLTLLDSAQGEINCWQSQVEKYVASLDKK